MTYLQMLAILSSYMRGQYTDSITVLSNVINKINYEGEIRNHDRYLLTKYRVPQRYSFNVTSGDILVFHHIQKTGK